MPVPQMQGLDTLYKPWGMTAGGMVGRRETDMEAADLLNLEEGMLGNVIKQVEASRAANDFSDPRMEALRQQGIMGDNMSKSAKGQFDTQTLETGIGSKNAKNRAEQSGSEIESMINGLDASIAMIQANGPAGMAMATRGMPLELQKIVAQAGPAAPQVLMKLSEMLKQQRMMTPQHMGKIAEQDNKAENDYIISDAANVSREKVSAADNSTRYGVEQMGIDAGKYKRGGSGVSITAVYAKMTPAARLGAVQRVLATGIDPETGEALTEMSKLGYERMYEQDKRTVDASNASKTAGKLAIPQIANQPEVRPPSVGGNSSGGQTSSGVKYKVVP